MQFLKVQRFFIDIVLILSTFVLNMDTKLLSDSLSKVLFGKTRGAVLALLFSHTGEQFYLRQIARETGCSPGALQRELNQLLEAGLVIRRKQGHQTYYQVNRESPVYEELKDLVSKTVGLNAVLRSSLEHLSGRIRFAVIFGSLARGAESSSSDVDILIVGDVHFSEVVEAFQETQRELRREINPVVYSEPEFLDRVGSDHYFVSRVLDAPITFLIGNRDELDRLVE